MRLKLLKAVNLVMFLAIVMQFTTGFLGHSLGEWFNILHKKAVFGLLFLVVIHIILNSGWIITSYFRKSVK